MAEGPGNGVIATTRDDRDLRDLAAARRELVASVTRQIDFSVKQLQMTPADAARRVREYLETEPDTVEAERVSWLDLSNLIECDAERGQALWQRLRDEAANEIGTGTRTSRSLERPTGSKPYDRAQFAAVIEGLFEALKPRDQLEELLIHQMAAAYHQHLTWQTLATQRVESEAWHGESDKRRALANMAPSQRERYENDYGWVPPRVSDAEAIEQAVLMADRYQRSFLRLMKAFRDNRRLFGALIVAGGQVNIGEQQVNVHQEQPQRSTGVRTAPIRRTTPVRVRKTGRTA
jgi:hypothetical protein